MPELHDHILSLECYAARLMLKLCGIEATRRTLRFEPGVTVPVYVDGIVSVKGAIPILRHLAATDLPRWRAADPEVARWLAFAEGPLAAVSEARNIRLFDAPGDLAPATTAARRAIRTVEDHLTDQQIAGIDWIAGPTVTLADVALFPWVALSHDAGIGHEDFPAISLWHRRVRALKDFISMPGIPDYF